MKVFLNFFLTDWSVQKITDPEGPKTSESGTLTIGIFYIKIIGRNVFFLSQDSHDQWAGSILFFNKILYTMKENRFFCTNLHNTSILYEKLKKTGVKVSSLKKKKEKPVFFSAHKKGLTRRLGNLSWLEKSVVVLGCLNFFLFIAVLLALLLHHWALLTRSPPPSSTPALHWFLCKGTVAWDSFFAHCILSRIEKNLRFMLCQ